MESPKQTVEVTNCEDILSRRIPGFAGYVDKAKRREVDCALRAYVADQLSAQRDRLAGLELKLAVGKNVTTIAEVDRVLTRLQLLIEGLRSSAIDYQPWLEADALPEDDLKYLYECELSLLAGADSVATGVHQLSATIDRSEPLAACAGDLISWFEILAERFCRRQKAARNLV